LKLQIQIAEAAATPTSEVVAKVSVWTVLAPF
jgi:hypothetical protein